MLEQVLQYQKDKLSVHAPTLLYINMVKQNKTKTKTSHNKKQTTKPQPTKKKNASKNPNYMSPLPQQYILSQDLFLTPVLHPQFLWHFILFTVLQCSPPVPPHPPARPPAMHIPSTISSLSSQLQPTAEQSSD